MIPPRTRPACISLEWPRALLFSAAAIAVTAYMIWRLGTFNPDAPIFSAVIYTAEAFGVMTMVMHAFQVWRMAVRESPPCPPGYTVDVFIPTINEPVSVVRRTALSALAMDYPHRTWILDDGSRQEIKHLAETLGCGYLARPDNEHAKAGNLNYALAHTNAEFIALFDADHAPKRSFLTRTLGYFFDPMVAFVQTPQDFYNLDSFQHRARREHGRIWTEQSLFFRIIQRGKDLWNAAFFCGSCAVIRRSALEKVGGFATGTVTEDLHTSVRLHKAGYKSVYHYESLAFGIAPAQVGSFLHQRIRWGQGAMQVWRREGIVFSRGLTIPQKICYLASILTYFEGWQKGIFYFTPAIVLFTGIVPIMADSTQFALFFLPYITLSLWSFSELGRGYSRVFMIEQYNMARFAAFCWATMGLFLKNLKFRVTSKRMTGRLRYTLYLVPHYAVFAANAAAIPLGIMALIKGAGDMHQVVVSANVIWAAVNLLLACLVLGFALARVRYQRQDYRFVLPLAAILTLRDGRTAYAGVEDISSSGVLLALPSSLGLSVGDAIYGHLRLPGGAIPIHTEVCAAHGRRGDTETLGCRFIWDSAQACEKLELFLYGSDIEWQVHRLNERSPTPLESLLGGAVRWHNFVSPAALTSYEYNDFVNRSPLLYRPAGADEDALEPGMIAYNDNMNQSLAVVFTPFELGEQVECRVFTDQGWERLRGQVVKENGVDRSGLPMYYYELRTEAPHGIH